eukprot:2801889-Amphidinium_carterae.1
MVSSIISHSCVGGRCPARNDSNQARSSLTGRGRVAPRDSSGFAGWQGRHARRCACAWLLQQLECQ